MNQPITRRQSKTVPSPVSCAVYDGLRDGFAGIGIQLSLLLPVNPGKQFTV